jgi:hypothetical protein
MTKLPPTITRCRSSLTPSTIWTNHLTHLVTRAVCRRLQSLKTCNLEGNQLESTSTTPFISLGRHTRIADDVNLCLRSRPWCCAPHQPRPPPPGLQRGTFVLWTATFPAVS